MLAKRVAKPVDSGGATHPGTHLFPRLIHTPRLFEDLQQMSNMQTLLHRLWQEDSGALLSAELMLIASILVVGVIVGLSAFRDSVVTELADVAQAIANVDQSYSYSGVSGHHTYSGGGAFHDRADFCDRDGLLTDKHNSKCVRICSAVVPVGEGGGHKPHGKH